MLLKFGEWQIRSWRREDKESLVTYANNLSGSINLRDSFPYPYSSEDAKGWINLASRQDPETNSAIADSKEAIGGIGLRLGNDVFRRSAELGYWLGEPHWGKGIATAAVQALTEFAFLNFDLARIEAAVYDWNPASARALVKAGYVCEGRLRKSITKNCKTIDRLLYAKVLE